MSTVDVNVGAVNIAPVVYTQTVAGISPSLHLNLAPAVASQLAAAYGPTFTVTVAPALQTVTITATDPTLATGVADIAPSVVQQLVTALAAVVSQPVTWVNVDHTTTGAVPETGVGVTGSATESTQGGSDVTFTVTVKTGNIESKGSS